MATILETRQLRLREMVPDDLDFLASMLGDAEVMRHYPAVLSRDESREWLERQLWRYAEYGHGHWLAIHRESGEPVGQIGLVMQEVDGQWEREIGYMIHRPFWRRGFAIEAALGVRRQAFEERGLAKVISLVRPENLPSQGVARKLGMQPERLTMFRGYQHHVFTVRRESQATSPDAARLLSERVRS